MKWRNFAVLFIFVLISFILYGAYTIFRPPAGVRGKSPAMPITGEFSSEDLLAQDLALTDLRVQDLTVGRRSEVFGIHPVLADQFTQASLACAFNDCRQVEIYNFDEDSAVTAIVDIDNRQVLDVLSQPGIHPGINKRLSDLAVEIALQAPEVVEALGYKPNAVDMAPVEADLLNSSCEGGHLCAGPTIELNDRILWAIVDLTEERLAGIAWTNIFPDKPGQSQLSAPQGCPPAGSVNRDGWTLDHEVTGSDGLRLDNVAYQGVPILTSVKLVEWHADYGASGFRDATGCTGGGGFPIYPFGDTLVLDLLDDMGVVGFEVVQDFRMSNWGNSCNYRYEQRLQFFADGRFRVVSGAYGKGCGTNALYRPVIRIDVAVNGDDNDTFSRWDGSVWETMATEDYLVPYAELGHGPHEIDPNGYSWRIDDVSGRGFLIEQDVGQFDGLQGRGALPFLYPTLHHANEGDTDLGAVGSCCNDDHVQGPDQYVNGESIANENIVLWYVPQMDTDVTAGSYYCWTITGEPSPETYPCFSGPMFHPVGFGFDASFVHNGPVELGDPAMFTNTSSGAGITNFDWTFGDSITSTLENPTHIYSLEGVYTVTLTISNSLFIDAYTDTIAVGSPAVAGFEHNGPVDVSQSAIFTNTSQGSSPMTFHWGFGDGDQSMQVSPVHPYISAGIYTATLTATNYITSSTFSDWIAVGVAPSAAYTYTRPALVEMPVQFTNLSAGGKSYQWDFGDGLGTSTAEDPSYVYQNSGTYTITLTVDNQFGTDIAQNQVQVFYPHYLPIARKQ